MKHSSKRKNSTIKKKLIVFPSIFIFFIGSTFVIFQILSLGKLLGEYAHTYATIRAELLKKRYKKT